jgi:predicted CoA-binding protein
MKLLVLLVLLISLCRAQCSKILFIAPMPAHSHFTLAFRLAKELADRGHEVTCINPYPQERAIKNYRDIPVVELVEYLDGKCFK